jgi:hypothetical protein
MNGSRIERTLLDELEDKDNGSSIKGTKYSSLFSKYEHDVCYLLLRFILKR